MKHISVVHEWEEAEGGKIQGPSLYGVTWRKPTKRGCGSPELYTACRFHGGHVLQMLLL